MALNFHFRTPAGQQDFPAGSQKQVILDALWDTNLDAFTQQGMVGNPWNVTNSAPITNYFNPKETPVTSDAAVVPVQWVVFPNRINYYCSAYSQTDIYSLADTGYDTKGNSFPQITNPCTNANVLFGPYGPRGWQDEYCEWSITYGDAGEITRIDFTCESPEYWNSLWMVDPNQVLSIYRSTLDNNNIQLADLFLADVKGNPIIDPSTGNPVYNPLNKWNSGTKSTPTSGGAMHLTSTPNTLQTDIGLANASTIQRKIGNTNPETLICCAQYGQPMRNSDPHIGQAVNQTVANVGSNPLKVSLCNPPGLFMQLPDFSLFQFPEGTTWQDFYEIKRGVEVLNDDFGNLLPGNFILHAVFKATATHKISDVKINKNGTFVPITWAGQIAETINNQIVAWGMDASNSPTAYDCVQDAPTPAANPLQLFHLAVFNAMNNYAVPNPVNKPMTLLSNSTLIPPHVMPGAQNVSMALICATTITDPYPTISFDGTDISATITGVSTVTYAVPGNSYPSESTVLFIDLSVKPTPTKYGLRNIYITNSGMQQSAAMPGLLFISAPDQA